MNPQLAMANQNSNSKGFIVSFLTHVFSAAEHSPLSHPSIIEKSTFGQVSLKK
jgi:hypothetical protein